MAKSGKGRKSSKSGGSGKGAYTTPPDGSRPAKSKPSTPYVQPALGKGKGPAQPKTITRPKQGAAKRKTAPKTKKRP